MVRWPGELTDTGQRVGVGDSPGFGTRELYSKCSTFPRFARKVDGSAETPHYSLHDSQPKSAARRFGSEERVEHLGLCLEGHATTSVGHLQLHVIALRQFC